MAKGVETKDVAEVERVQGSPTGLGDLAAPLGNEESARGLRKRAATNGNYLRASDPGKNTDAGT